MRVHQAPLHLGPPAGGRLARPLIEPGEGFVQHDARVGRERRMRTIAPVSACEHEIEQL